MLPGAAILFQDVTEVPPGLLLSELKVRLAVELLLLFRRKFFGRN